MSATAHPGHATTELYDCCCRLTDIDIGMVDVVSPLWRLGVHTISCCEGTLTRPAYVHFRTPDDAAKSFALLYGVDATWECRVILGAPQNVVRFHREVIADVARRLADVEADRPCVQ
jgi:hypothetical protein